MSPARWDKELGRYVAASVKHPPLVGTGDSITEALADLREQERWLETGGKAAGTVEEWR